jgi:exosortase/archaeosortase family protein
LPPTEPASTSARTKPRLPARRRASPGRIVLVCLAFWGVALWLVERFPAIEAFGVRLTILSVRAVFRLAGLPVKQVGSALLVRDTSFTIAPDCSPHLPFLIFAGAVLATPASLGRRAVGLVAGAVLLQAFNTMRIVALFAVEARRPEWFEFAHVYLWQIGTIVAVLAAFVAWLQWTSRPVATA